MERKNEKSEIAYVIDSAGNQSSSSNPAAKTIIHNEKNIISIQFITIMDVQKMRI